MRKIYFKIVAPLIAATLTMGVCQCSDDDDSDGKAEAIADAGNGNEDADGAATSDSSATGTITNNGNGSGTLTNNSKSNTGSGETTDNTTTQDEDKIDVKEAVTGRWYLKSYGVADATQVTCTWGEYISIREKYFLWMKRQLGWDTSYKYTVTSSGFHVTDGPDPIPDVNFTIKSYDGTTMLTYSDDGFYRLWNRR